MESVIAFLVALCLSLVGTAVAIRLCARKGWLTKPRADRWHRRPIARFGGVAIWLSFVLTASFFVPWSSSQLWALIAISSLLFLVGLYDDIWTLSPRRKLLLQCLSVSLVFAVGIVYPFRENMAINLLVSAFWLIGIVNAINLIDNMDGLSAGVSLIAAAYLIFIFWSKGASDKISLLAALAGAILGFLIFNFHPAKIFMGDAGALFVGFLLASLTLLDVTHLSGMSSLLFVPVLLLSVPIVDTLFVSVTRRLRGQPISLGGTDHTSHRLVRFGLDERSAVIFLYVLSFLSGSIALWIRQLSPHQALALVSFWLLFLGLFGISLFRPVPTAQETKWKKHALLRRALHADSLSLILDPVVLSLSYFCAFLLRFRGEIPAADLSLFLQSWPIVLGVKLACFVGLGIYRRSWWRSARRDAYQIVQAAMLGGAFSVIMLVGVDRFAGYSRVVFVFDAVLSVILLLVTRQFSQFLYDVLASLSSPSDSGRRALVLGTHQEAEVALRLLRNLRIQCVGLIDLNHGRDFGRYVWGVPVVGGVSTLSEAARKTRATEVVLAERGVSPSRVTEIVASCERLSLPLTELGLRPLGANGTSADPVSGLERDSDVLKRTAANG
ncbi:MAG: hypothetical protein L0Z50_02065 [Verrucomicrobiales bacterium]|nr:hypothetical protein [Verrucomicrobiales bacterium]